MEYLLFLLISVKVCWPYWPYVPIISGMLSRKGDFAKMYAQAPQNVCTPRFLHKTQTRQVMEFTLPLTCLVSVVCFWIPRFPSDRIDTAPGTALLGIEFSLLLLGQFFIRDILFYGFLLSAFMCGCAALLRKAATLYHIYCVLSAVFSKHMHRFRNHMHTRFS